MSDLGILNFEIERIIKNSNNGDLINNFDGVFSSDKIDFHGIMKERSAKYLFLVSNTDRAETTGTHWWEILDVHPKTEIFFFILLKSVVLNTS